MTEIFLGYEVDTGEPVHLPLHHIAITGVTRLSGKTTTVEALMKRLGGPVYKSLAFRTKRGEVSFRGANLVHPYLVQRTDWEYVQSLLEAAMRERLKFERSWIIRACKGAQTLRQVYDNIQAELNSPRKIRGLDESVWTNLAAYFEKVLPQIEEHPFANLLELDEGPNVMDLGHLSEEVQALCISSALEEIYQNGSDTLIAIPEAWKFIPQQRGNPVKWAAQHVIREGGAVGVYLILDSQDIAGVEKAVLKSVDTWLLGRQRERNEVDRVLKQLPLPAAQRPKPEDIMSLGLGQFYVAAGDWCRKVYVAPAWLDLDTARAVAMGDADMPEQDADLEEHQEDEMYRERAEAAEAALAKAQQENDTNEGLLSGLQVALEKSEQQSRANEGLLSELEVQVADLNNRVMMADALSESVTKAIAEMRRAAESLFGFSLSSHGNGQGDAREVQLTDDVMTQVVEHLKSMDFFKPGQIVRLAPVPALQEVFKGQIHAKMLERSEELVQEVVAMSPRQKQLLSVLGASAGGAMVPGAVTIQEAARLLGHDIRASGGARDSWGSEMGVLVKGKWAYKDTGKKGFRHRIGLKIKEELRYWTESEEDVDVVVQNVLYVASQSVGLSE